MADFTPGPWKVFYASRGADILGVGDASGGSIAHMWRDGDERDANARLIAAAPDLLEAIQEALCAIVVLDEGVMGFAEVQDRSDQDFGYLYPIRDELIAKIDAAIAKATGQ